MMKERCPNTIARTIPFARGGRRRGVARARNWQTFAVLRSKPSTPKRLSGRFSEVTPLPSRRRRPPRAWSSSRRGLRECKICGTDLLGGRPDRPQALRVPAARCIQCGDHRNPPARRSGLAVYSDESPAASRGERRARDRGSLRETKTAGVSPPPAVHRLAR